MYCNIIMILIINDFIKFSLQYSISLLIFAIWKSIVWKRKSESLVINRNQCPRWVGIQQVMALQDPRLYTAHLWILPVPRPARTLPMPLIFLLLVFLHVFGPPPIRVRFPFLFILVSPPRALGTRALARYTACFFWANSSLPKISLSWRKPLSNLFVVPKLRSFTVRSLSSISIFLQLD